MAAAKYVLYWNVDVGYIVVAKCSFKSKLVWWLMKCLKTSISNSDWIYMMRLPPLGVFVLYHIKPTWGSVAWAHCCCTYSESLLDSAAKDSGSETRTRMMYCPSSVLLWNNHKEKSKARKTKRRSDLFTVYSCSRGRTIQTCLQRQRVFVELRRSSLNKSPRRFSYCHRWQERHGGSPPNVYRSFKYFLSLSDSNHWKIANTQTQK